MTKGNDAQRFEGEALEMAERGIARQKSLERRRPAEGEIPIEHEERMRDGEKEGGDAGMTPVVEQRKEPPVQSRQRTDRQDHR